MIILITTVTVLQDILYEFVDRGNGILTLLKLIMTLTRSGSFDLNEPYEDRNCNGKWDDAEVVDW